MKSSFLLRCLATVIGVCVAHTAIHAAPTAYDSPGLQALTGSWSTGTSGATVDFGPARGLGTITITSLNGGGFNASGNPNTFAGLGYAVTDTVLSNGDTLHLDSVIVFSPTNNGTGGLAGGDSGFSITFSLDSGMFKAGDILGVGSLDYRLDRSTYFQPGTSFSALETGTPVVQADAQMGFNNHAPLQAVAGSSGLTNGTLYTATGETVLNSISDFGFFRLSADTSSFTSYFTSTGALQGVVLTFATPVPEPSGAVLVAIAGVLGIFRRRRRC